MNIAQAILAKPHTAKTAPEIYERAKIVEENRRKFWASQKHDNKQEGENKNGNV